MFDNEKPAHACYVAPFAMDSTLVTNAQYAEFVADGGYQKPDFWSAAGRAWLMGAGALGAALLAARRRAVALHALRQRKPRWRRTNRCAM